MRAYTVEAATKLNLVHELGLVLHRRRLAEHPVQPLYQHTAADADWMGPGCGKTAVGSKRLSPLAAPMPAMTSKSRTSFTSEEIGRFDLDGSTFSRIPWPKDLASTDGVTQVAGQRSGSYPGRRLDQTFGDDRLRQVPVDHPLVELAFIRDAFVRAFGERGSPDLAAVLPLQRREL